MDDSDTLVRRRSRRSTAGNRMEAALAEMTVEDLRDGEDDHDFIADAEEGDEFGSDFESTDEEATQATPEASEKAIADDERRQRKAVRSRLEKATAAAAARQRVTFNPDVIETASTPVSERDKKRRRVSLSDAVGADAGQPLSTGRRQSGRALTALARTASHARWVEEEKQKSSAPRKVKAKETPPTQDELLKRALDMEDGNIAAHRDYLANEEEKRRRAHIVRASVQGPLVRWVSRREVIVIPPPDPANNFARPQQPSSSAAASSTYSAPSGSSLMATSITPTAVPFQPDSPRATYTALSPPTSASASSTAPDPVPLVFLPPPPVLAKEVVGRQYVLYGLSQDPEDRPPAWKETMAALFGNHVAWDQIRVYTAKNRPLSRPVLACPITGLPAPYQDPRTGVPFATVEAYATLTKILNHEYIWSPVLGCYITPYENVDDNKVDVKGRGEA